MTNNTDKKLILQGGHKLWTPRKPVHFNFSNAALLIPGCGCCGDGLTCDFDIVVDVDYVFDRWYDCDFDFEVENYIAEWAGTLEIDSRSCSIVDDVLSGSVSFSWDDDESGEDVQGSIAWTAEYVNGAYNLLTWSVSNGVRILYSWCSPNPIILNSGMTKDSAGGGSATTGTFTLDAYGFPAAATLARPFYSDEFDYGTEDCVYTFTSTAT